MSRTRRESVLTEFRAANGPDVLLLSLGAGALGLNLTCASNVILMECVRAQEISTDAGRPFWHSAIESQAIDRYGVSG